MRSEPESEHARVAHASLRLTAEKCRGALVRSSSTAAYNRAATRVKFSRRPSPLELATSRRLQTDVRHAIAWQRMSVILRSGLFWAQ